jgi:peptide/nickel transport system permease protein
MHRKAFVSFFIRRTLLFLLVFWSAVTINFIIPRFAPGNPVREGIMARYGMQADQSVVNELVAYYEEYFGLNDPLIVQYVRFLGNTARGDLGYSITQFPRTVLDMIREKVVWTLQLVLPSTLLAAVLGALLGALFAWPRMPKVYNAIVPLLILFSAIPAFLAAVALVYVFAYKLDLLPLMGAYDNTFVAHVIPISQWATIPNYFHGPTLQQIVKHSILPMAALILVQLGGWALGMRGMMITIHNEDYMNFAEAKGLTDQRLFSYTLRNALLPMVTSLGLAFSNALTAGILVEVIFAYPGIGGLINGAIRTNDFPLIYANSVILVVLLAGATFVLDLVYPLLDPRINYEGR